jgi:hypothetical protein
MTSQGYGLQDPRAPNPFADPRQQPGQPGIQYAQRSQYESESDHDHYGSVNGSTTRLAAGSACPLLSLVLLGPAHLFVPRGCRRQPSLQSLHGLPLQRAQRLSLR